MFFSKVMIGSGISSDEFGSSPHPQKHSPINNKNNIDDKGAEAENPSKSSSNQIIEKEHLTNKNNKISKWQI